MARLPRVTPVGVPLHIIQRGNNRQVCFVAPEDHAAYAGWLKEYSTQYGVDIHAWVMMTNHVHLLCTPRRSGAVSSMMQSLGRRYVRYFNHEYQRTVILGTRYCFLPAGRSIFLTQLISTMLIQKKKLFPVSYVVQQWGLFYS